MEEKTIIEDEIVNQKIVDQNIPDTVRDKFPEMSSKELLEILGITVKKDDANKLLTFLCFLSAYVGDCQFNISFNAPSSSGKSYIPLEISKFFPQEDLLKPSYATPTSFFHEAGVFSEEKAGYIVDLSKKILIFVDQPHTELIQRLRSLLSHDEKEIRAQITDRNEKKGMRTKHVYLIGYPAVVFCTANYRMDEQESTRFILLSPDTDSEKIRAGIWEKILKESNTQRYKQRHANNPKIIRLKDRIEAIKNAAIIDVRIDDPKLIEETFYKKTGVRLMPRHQRDISRVLNLIKIFASFNFWHRQCNGNTVIATEKDINDAFDIWFQVYLAQELNVSPYLLDFYKNNIWTPYQKRNKGSVVVSRGLSKQEIMQSHSENYHTSLPDWKLQREILPSLESANLIKREPDPNDGRQSLITPITDLENYMQTSGGETEKDSKNTLDNAVQEYNENDLFDL